MHKKIQLIQPHMVLEFHRLMSKTLIMPPVFVIIDLVMGYDAATYQAYVEYYAQYYATLKYPTGDEEYDENAGYQDIGTE